MSNDALINEFLVESFENLSSINEDLTHLEKDPENLELLNKIYRTVHTMKGSASFLGYKKLQEITHAGENLLDELREQNLKITSEIIDTLLETFDLSNAILKNIESSKEEGEVDTSATQLKLEKHLSGGEDTAPTKEESDLESLVADHKAQAPAPAPAPAQEDTGGLSAAALESLAELVEEGKVDSASLEELKTRTAEPAQAEPEADLPVNSAAMDSLKELISEGKVDASALEELENLDDDVESPKVEPTKVDVVVDSQEVEIESSKKTVDLDQLNDDSQKSIVDSFVRVNVNILDKIMNVVGELVLNRNQILQFASNNDNSEFNRLSQQLNVITSELQSEVMSTRMQPIGNVLNKFERMVRDIARTHEKKINLRLIGQETELDKSLIETIKDPLVHIIRNSCDHGIESPADRKTAGKNETGQVVIKSYNESGQVTIEINDDGKGLDPEKIGQKAVEKGIVTQEKLASMTETQILNLIFKPGFSTAEKVTNISGRGVGMDVVKTNIEKIGGTVSVSSNKGEGTNFKLRIPLTLAIVPSLMIKSNGETFAIPQLNLVELVRLETKEDMASIEKISGSEFLKLRGELTPIFRLGEKLDLDTVHSKSMELSKVLDRGDEQEEGGELQKVDDALNIVILNAEENVYGIVVEEILDTEEIVVKPLNNFLKDINIFGGATIRGDGKVALILDALGFLTEVSQADIEKHDHDALGAEDPSAINETEYQENLLFKLHDDRIYAIPLSLVSRLEEINVEKIEKTGNQKIIRYLDAPMPLINVEKILQLEGVSSLDRYKNEGIKNLSCIVVHVSGKNFGIIVNEVLDISIDNIDIDDGAVDREGIMGTVFIDEKTVSLLDLYAILGSQKLGVVKKMIASKQLNGKKILLVDDSPMYRKLEGDSLREIGFDVTTANHGMEGFEKLQAGDYDLVITDIEMPELDGFNFAKKIRAESNKKDIPIIALSTRHSESDQAKGKECGFSHHLEKFKKDEVIDLVNRILEEKENGSRTTAS